MATKLYFHDAASSVSGTLPSSEQSSLTAADTFEGSDTTNRSINATIGTSQVTLTNASIGNNNTNDYYVTRFVSPQLNQTSISANTWTYNFAADGSANNANFPVSGPGQPVYVNFYVWKTSNGTKTGTILDGNTNGDFDEPSGTAEERVMHGTFAGSAVSSITTSDDVLVFEMWFRVTQSNPQQSRDQRIHYDGTVENTTLDALVTDHAAFISTPEDITFLGGTLYERPLDTETVNISEQLDRVTAGVRTLPETTNITEDLTRQFNGNRRVNRD